MCFQQHEEVTPQCHHIDCLKTSLMSVRQHTNKHRTRPKTHSTEAIHVGADYEPTGLKYKEMNQIVCCRHFLYLRTKSCRGPAELSLRLMGSEPCSRLHEVASVRKNRGKGEKEREKVDYMQQRR